MPGTGVALLLATDAVLVNTAVPLASLVEAKLVTRALELTPEMVEVGVMVSDAGLLDALELEALVDRELVGELEELDMANHEWPALGHQLQRTNNILIIAHLTTI